MARLYEINSESTPGEVTLSLAKSLKNGLFAPTEKKFNALETEIASLLQVIELETEKLALEVTEKYIHIEKEFEQLRKLFRITLILSIASLLGIIATLLWVVGYFG